MKNQLLALLAFILLIFCGLAYSRPASSPLLAQEQGDVSQDFDDSVLKDIEDIESDEEGDSEDEDEEEDRDEEDRDEEDMDEEDMDEEDMDEEDMDEEDMDEEDMDEEDMDEEDMDEEDMDEEDMDEEDMDEEDMDEEDMDEEDMDEEDMDEEDMDEEDMDEEDMDEEDMDEEDMDEEDMDEEDMDEEDMDEEDMDEEDMDEEDMDEEDMDEEDRDEEGEDISLEEEPTLTPSDEDISLEEEPTLTPSDEDISLEEEPTLTPSDEDISLEEEPTLTPSDEDISLEEEPTLTPSDEDISLEEEPVPSIKEADELPVSAEDSQKFSEDSLNVIGNIRYVAALDQIVIDSSEVISYQVHHNRKNNQIIIEVLQARLSENLKWPYVLKDFGTGFGMIQADAKNENTVRILIQVKENYPLPQVTLGETGETMRVSFQGVAGSGLPLAGGGVSSGKRSLLPPQTLENFYFGNLEFSGHPLSFHVIDADVRQVLRFISEESGLNMVIDETVKGKVTLKLENVPWDQAFLTILQVKNLSYIGQGNVVMISTLDALDEKAKKLKEMAEHSKALAPFQTKMVSVSYAKIDELASKVQPFLTQSTAKGGKKGGVVVHEESGTLVITDTERVIEKIKKLVGFLDKPPKQVMIEARIVDAVENFSENFGLTWDITGSTPFSVNVSGFLEDLRNSWSGAGLSVRQRGSVYTLDVSGFPVVGSLSAELNLAETKGYARVVSSPKVVTLSGKKASITRNAPILIPKSVTSNVGTSNTEVKFEPLDIKISLDVTPRITPSGSVFMDVQISRSSPGPRSGKEGEAVAISRSAQTQVLVKNGHTVVIGGIYQYDEISGNAGVPFLRHIPFLKFLFSDTTFSTTKNELLVFLTPKLIDDVTP